MKRIAMVVVWMVACGGRPVARTPVQVIEAVEVFDTNTESAVRIAARHAEALHALRTDASEQAVHAVVAAIRAEGGFAYVGSALITYSGGGGAYLTIDVVDQEDAAARMPFRAAPTGRYRDPQGVLATWEAYERRAMAILKRDGRLPPPAHCASFHCFGDPAIAELRPLAEELSAKVPAHVEELAAILRDEGREAMRAAAAYALAYGRDGEAVVAALMPALRDPSMLVRNNAMRVLAEIALHHPELAIPVEPLLEALRYPETTDRNKAAATLSRLLAQDGAERLYAQVAREAGTTLVAMLGLAQPNNHDFAYEILKRISGQDYGERDLAAWRAWLARTLDPE